MATMADSNVPDWLKDDDNDIHPSKVHYDSEIGTASPTAAGSMELEKRSTRDDTSESTTGSLCGRCFQWTISGISLIFFILFATSASLQHNDSGGSAMTWLIFYLAHSVLAASFLCLRCCKAVSGIEKPVRLLGFAMLGYSLALVGVSIKKLMDAHESNAGGDAENFNDKEEKTFELAGAGLGLLSAVFHISIQNICSRKSKQNDDDDHDDKM